MTTLTRKQREIAEREQLIMQVARKALVEQGYLGLNMDRIAEATEYSKGTIYQHFSSKEDLLGALTVETMQKRVDMFKRAAAFDGRPRERLLAIGVADQLFFQLYPDHYKTEEITRQASIAEKVSPERKAAVERLEADCFDNVTAVVADALDVGDLVLSAGVPDCQVIYGLRSMAVGAHSLEHHLGDLPHLVDMDFKQALWGNYMKLLDGYGWKPLSTEWDYQATRKRVLEEVFEDEYRQLNSA